MRGMSRGVLRSAPMGWLLAMALMGQASCSTPDEPSVPPGEDLDPLDGEDDDFLSGGKTDGLGIEEGSDEACAVLKLASLATESELDNAPVRLNAKAAREIARVRLGLDGVQGTDDDVWFTTLLGLDNVKHVGPSAFRRLRDAAATDSRWACGDVSVQLLSFNDFHGNLKAPSGSSGRIQTGPDPNVDRVDAGGAEFMATHIKALKATNPNTLIVAAGDIIGATPLLSALFHDEPSVESMNLMGLTISSVGNHEFDEGLDELYRMQDGGCHPVDGCQDGDGFEGADFSYLAANVIEDEVGDTILPPYTIRCFGHASVGFIGMTLEGTPLVTSQAGTVGLTFLDEADTVNALVPELKATGVETIVLLIHEGGAATGRFNQCVGISGPIFEIVNRLDPAVDVVISGHTNAAHVCNINNRLVTSAASFGRLITDLDLVINEKTGDVVSMQGQNNIVTRNVTPDPDQTALITKYERFAAPLANRVVAAIAADLTRVQAPSGESTLGQHIADAQLGATRADGAQAAFMNPGGIRTDLVFAQISGGELPGQITFGELFAVQPFGNILITLDITGAQLETMLEQQWSLVNGAEKANILAVSAGFAYTWDSTRPIGDRVDPASITLNGELIDPTRTYRITVNGFLADGGDGFSVLKQGTGRLAGPLDLTAFELHAAAQNPLLVGVLNRITRR